MRFLSVLALAAALPLAACDSDDVGEALPSITEIVVSNPAFSTLEAAVIQAGLDDDLAGPGPFTVFAPTDPAFADLLEALDATPEQLLARDDLGQILTLHVVSGAVRAADLSVGQAVGTLNGRSLTVVSTDSGGLGLDADADGAADARILATDIEASNGVIHTLDAVLL